MMFLHSRTLLVVSVGCALSLLSSTALAATGLFPTSNPGALGYSMPGRNAPLPPLEPAVRENDGSNGGPVKIVIPNLQKQKRAPKREVREQAKPAAPAPVQAQAAPPAVQANMAALSALTPAAGKPVSEGEKASWYQRSMALLNDTFSNAVILSFVNVNRAAYANAEPPAPAPLPASWQVANNGVDFALLTPAAGEPTQPAAAAIPTVPSAGAIPNNPTVAAPAPVAPATPTAPVVTAPVVDATEPAPALSSASKKIADKLPAQPVEAAPKKEKVQPIERETEKGDVFGGNVSVKSHEAMGIKMDVKRPKLDMNYQLEKAYEALVAGNTEAAIEAYQTVLTNNPKNKDALFGLATTYHRVGQLDLARSLYGKLLELDPGYRDGLNNFLVLLADEAPQEALIKMQELERKNPGFSPIPAQMAIIYQKLGNTDKAVDSMFQAVNLSPENITYRYNLAVLLDKKGDYERASQLYQQVLEANGRGVAIPGDPSKIQQRLTFIRSNGSR